MLTIPRDRELPLRVVRPILAVVAVLVVLGAGLLIYISRANLAHPAANYLSRSIGRQVSIGSLRIHPGAVTTIDLRSVAVDNILGGTRPKMIRLDRLRAEIRLFSLLSGPFVIQSLSVEGGNLLLERRADGRANWVFQPTGVHAKSDEPSRVELPAMLSARFVDIEVDFLASSGALLKTSVRNGSVMTSAPDAPVKLKMSGAYNDVPFDLDGDLSSFAALHRASVRFPAKLTIASGGSTLHFDGTFTDPLAVDGAVGKLDLDASSLAELGRIGGATVPWDIPLRLSGEFVHDGGLWRLTDTSGALASQDFKGMLELGEGTVRQPDAVKVSASFASLDTNAILKPAPGAPQPAAGISLMMDPAPSTVFDVQVDAGHFVYRTVAADAFTIKAKTGPGTLTVDDFALRIADGTARSKLTIADKDDKAVVDFDGALDGVDADKAGILLGWGPLPVDGPVNSHVIGRMIGANMSEARQTNRIFGVIAMNGGAIDRQVVAMAGTDIRLLFGNDDGVRKLYCLLAIINLRDGKGTIGPVRIKSSGGIIAGSGSYDSVHDVVDLVVGAQSKSWFSLDVPVRISGPITNFSVAPAFGASRQLNEIALPDDLPGPLKDAATANPCLKH